MQAGGARGKEGRDSIDWLKGMPNRPVSKTAQTAGSGTRSRDELPDES